MVDIETCQKLRDEYNTSSWAVWSDRFPKRGCIEENPDELVDFLEDKANELRPDVVFLALNPSTDTQEEQEGRYTNFHSPSLEHRDVDLRIAIEESGLTGGYMTDLSAEPTPNAEGIGPEDIEIQALHDQFKLLGEGHFRVICFGRRVFNLLKSQWDISHKELDESIWWFRGPFEEWTADFYSVYHYSQQDGSYTEKLRDQLDHIQTSKLP